MPHAVSLTSTPASSAIDEIRSLSRPFAALFGFLFLSMMSVCVVFILAALLYSGPSLRMPPDHTQLLIMPDLTEQVLASTIASADMPLTTRLVGIVSLGILQWGSLTMIFFQFRALYVIGRVMNLGREIELERASFV